MLRITACLFALLLILPLAFGIGLRPGRVDMNYLPNFEKTFPYYVSNTLNTPIKAEVTPFYENDVYEGAFTISKTDFELGPFEGQPFFVTLKLPPNAEAPGENRIGIMAHERDRKAKVGGVVLQGSVASVFHINGLYDGKYLQLSLSVSSDPEYKAIEFRLGARSLGTETIENLQGKVEVYDLPANGLLAALDAQRTDSGPLASWYDTTFTAQMSGAGMKPGLYRVLGTVYYDGAQRQVETYFRIGQQGLSIVGFPQKGVAGEIIKFPITVESQYNLPYDSVSATVELKDTETLGIIRAVQTLPVAVAPFEKKDLLGYLDLNGVALGIYRVNVLIRYDQELIGVEAEFRVTDANGNIHTGNRTGAAMIAQKPKKPLLTTTNILIGVIVLLLILNMLWFLRGRRREPPQEPLAQLQQQPEPPSQAQPQNPEKSAP